MANSRVNKKHAKRKYRNELHELKQCMAHQEEMLAELTAQAAKQEEILSLYYGEYRELKRHREKQYLMTYIRMRESMRKDMAVYEKKEETHTQGYRLLSMYVKEYTDMLEDHGVEIVDCAENEPFNPEIQKPIERIDVSREEQDNVVCKVYSSGYRWDGIVLKKMDVAVGICQQC